MSIASRSIQSPMPRLGIAEPPQALQPFRVNWRVAAPVAGVVQLSVSPAGWATFTLLPDETSIAAAALGQLSLSVSRDGVLLHLDGDGTRVTIDTASGRLLYARAGVLDTLAIPGGCLLAPTLTS